MDTLSETVDADLEKLPVDMPARVGYIAQFIGEFGPERVRELHV